MAILDDFAKGLRKGRAMEVIKNVTGEPVAFPASAWGGQRAFEYEFGRRVEDYFDSPHARYYVSGYTGRTGWTKT